MEEHLLKDTTGWDIFTKQVARMIEDAKNDIFRGTEPPFYDGDVRAVKNKDGTISLEAHHRGQWINLDKPEPIYNIQK